MLEEETASLLRTIIERTIGTAGSITLQDVLVADIPRGIKVYLRAEVLQWLRDDLSRASRFASLDQNSPAAAQLITAFLRSLCESYRFSREEYLAVLESGVNFVGNYLCHPQWTLEQFIFADRQRISAGNLVSRLAYTADYSYFGRLIEKIIVQRSLREIGAEEFRHWVMKIDDQIVKQHSARELAMLAKPIFEFVGFGKARGDLTIPLKPVLAFFEDKKMKILKEYIESICRLRGRDEVSLAELRELIEDLYLGSTIKEAGPNKAEENPPIPERDTITDVDGSEGPVDRRSDMAAGGASPDTGESISPVHPPEDAEPSVQTTGQQDRSKQNIPLSLTFAGLSSQAPPSESQLPDLNTIIPAKDRTRFVKKIFRKDEEYFNVVVTSLNTIPTWKEASLYLNTLFEMNHLDPFSEDVVEFTDLIQQRYTAKGGDQ